MALVSPGVEVTVIDESQYIPSAVNTVPYFIIATAQNKADAAGVGVAAGTTAANANKTYLITSQRDLAATFGVPFFYNTTTGTPINGYELNEYGLLAAYSALGVTNRAYVQRVDIDLTELTASLSRPTGDADNGTYWLDTSESTWGIFEWDQTTATFTNQVPIVITDTADVVNYNANPTLADYTPLDTIGSIGDYAVSAVSLANQHYYKNTDNDWVLVGSDAWKNSWATVQGTNSVAGNNLTAGANFFINGTLVTVPLGPNNNVAAFAAAITATNIPGVTATAESNKLTIYADSDATNDGSTSGGGIVTIELGNVSSAALLSALGIDVGSYRAPDYLPAYSYQAPRWRDTDNDPAPTGSIWQNISAVGNGMSLKLKKYDAALDVFVSQTTNVYLYDGSANAALDPTGGGKNIPVGTTYAQYNVQGYVTPTTDNAAFTIWERVALGATVVTGTTTPPLFVAGNTFNLYSTSAGSAALTQYLVTLSGTSVASFISSVSAANIPNVSASVNSAGNIVFTHSQGGTIVLEPLTGTPIATAGFTTSTPKVHSSSSAPTILTLSNWVGTDLFTYVASDSALGLLVECCWQPHQLLLCF